MNDVPDTELFSAYLDGELTADEQVRVEQFLAASLEARQLLEELRALGGTLQGLPQEKLGEDLSARVLKVAERRMLLPDRVPDKPPQETGDKPSAGRAAETLNPTDADSIGWLGIPWREISWRGMFSKRALIWSGVVVATAIIINFTPKPNQNVAKRDGQPAARVAAVASGATVASGDRREGTPPDARWEAAPSHAQKPLTDEGLAKLESQKATGDKDVSVTPEANRSPAREADRPEEPSALARRAGSGEMTKLAMRKAIRIPAEPAAERLAEEGLVGGAAKTDSAKADAGLAGAVRAEKKAGLADDGKAAPPIAAIAGNVPAPATMPMPAALMPAAPAPSPSAAPNGAPNASPSAPPSIPTGPPTAAVAKSAPQPPPADVAQSSKGPMAPRALGAGRGGAMRGPAKAPAESLDAGKDVAKAGETTQLLNGAGLAAANGNSLPSPSAKAAAAAPAMKPNGGQAASAETIVRLDVSTAAAEKRVFEDLLAHCGLRSYQNATYPALDSTTDNSNLPLDQVQGGGRRDGGQSPARQLRYEFDASPEEVADIIKEIRARLDSFSAPEIGPADSTSLPASSFAQNSVSGVNNSMGGMGGGGGGPLAARSNREPQATAGAAVQPPAAPFPAQSQQAPLPGQGGPAQRPQAVTLPAQSQQAGLPGGAKQHVVVVLHVVEHLPAAPAKAEQ
jgi:hypothetical protein